jgi:hypothetical protein
MKLIQIYILSIGPLMILQFFKNRKHNASSTKQLKDELGLTDIPLHPEPEDIEAIGVGKKQYKIYKNNQDKVRVVKVGWSHPGFFWPIGWYIYKKMYRSAQNYITLGFLVVLVFSSNIDSNSIYVVILYAFQLIFSCITGYMGNAWYETDLWYVRGYVLKTIVNAGSQKSAKAFYEKWNNDKKIEEDSRRSHRDWTFFRDDFDDEWGTEV